MKELLTQNRTFFVSAGIYLVLGFVWVALFPMGAIELEVYQWHSEPLTYFFKAANFLGDGYFLPFCFPILIVLVSPRAAITVGLSVLLTFSIITVLKIYVFPDADRPMRYFKEAITPFMLDGMEQNHHNSFPSGHSGQAMAIAATLSVFFRRKSIGFVLLFIAISVAWSRVYLMQHFIVDTLAGGSIALLISLLCINLKIPSRENTWLDKPLLTIFRRKEHSL